MSCWCGLYHYCQGFRYNIVSSLIIVVCYCLLGLMLQGHDVLSASMVRDDRGGRNQTTKVTRL